MNKQVNPANSESQSSYPSAEDEVIVRQLMGLIRQKWPEQFNVKRADLKVVRPNGKLVWPKKQRKRNLARLKVARGKCTAKKSVSRTAEVLHAEVIAFPGVLFGDYLDERYEFVHKHAGEWSTTDAEGTQAVDWKMRRMHEVVWEEIRKRPLTDHVKRAEIKRGRARIETRNRIKAYLEWRGVDIAELRNAEDALFALFGFVETSP